ncbi:hypothetical protein FEF26_11175 [Nesterenkonia salmonea]|uniref:B3/B4 tRNA-binding domain-containing protein n=1 Tax=Nesterenkonia salmonea TaxID=1804987 RepID=A0A5R9BAS4_9MICC|nr:phenylalanine--tRNA ligase beta subunit-related protein [Nesterenkonia salmonea]TLP94865.1 hypothetical protein FEF26_11175 [Nesterenkonia salmonea]
MPELTDLKSFLTAAHVDEEVFTLRPDYTALLLVADGIAPGASDAASEKLVHRAEEFGAALQQEQRVEEWEHIASWREAHRAFGAKPKRTRNSLEALTLRTESGLPRVNRLTDIYNAISVLHQIPLGGEDLNGYTGAPRLVRAKGDEPFDVKSGGEVITEYPKPGEVIWCDDLGGTCRRWNWRQGSRTQLTDETTQALFIMDALSPVGNKDLLAAAEDLVRHLRAFSPGLRSAHRVITAENATGISV